VYDRRAVRDRPLPSRRSPTQSATPTRAKQESEGDIRGALTQARQIIQRRNRPLRLSAPDYRRQPVAATTPREEAGQSSAGVHRRNLARTLASFFEAEKRQNRGPVRCAPFPMIPRPAALDARGRAPGLRMPSRSQYLVDQRAQAGDSLLIRIVDGGRGRSEIRSRLIATATPRRWRAAR